MSTHPESADPAVIQQVEQAIWRLDMGTLLQLPQVPERTWAGSIQFDFRCFTPRASLPYPTAPLPPDHRVCVVMMVKDEADIIGHNLEWLYFSGVRRFVIGDNASTDGTRDVLHAFAAVHPDVSLEVIDDPVVSHTQGLKTTAWMQHAVEKWPDVQWVLPIDADEFLIAIHGFAPLAALGADVDVVPIPKVIHLRHALGNEVDTGSPLGLMGVRNPLFCCPPKVAVRARPAMGVLGVTGGNHQAPNGHLLGHQGGFAVGLYYREFQTRSFEHFLRKVRNGGRAVLAARAEGKAEGSDQWVDFFRVLERDGERGLQAVYDQTVVQSLNDHYTWDPFYGCRVHKT